MLIEKILGQYVETLFANAFFWRDKHKSEVDVVIKNNSKLIPIEVKFKRNLTKQDIKGLLKFMNEFNINQGFVLTRDLFKEEKIDEKYISFIPAWLFLLCNRSG